MISYQRRHDSNTMNKQWISLVETGNKFLQHCLRVFVVLILVHACVLFDDVQCIAFWLIFFYSLLFLWCNVAVCVWTQTKSTHQCKTFFLKLDMNSKGKFRYQANPRICAFIATKREFYKQRIIKMCYCFRFVCLLARLYICWIILSTINLYQIIYIYVCGQIVLPYNSYT